MDHAKYLVMAFDGLEQAIRFPTSISHREIADRFPGIPVSAGFCANGSGWVGGESESLKLRSRPGPDKALLQQMLTSPRREVYDLVTLEREKVTRRIHCISFP